jgi:single-stranded-DNA-specific exonuclease
MRSLKWSFYMSPSPKRWQVTPPAPPSHIARFSHLHPITVQVLYNRGITDPASVTAFFNGESGEANPFDLQGMPAAVTRLRQALRGGETIVVYGDFDADGVTATALLVQTLRALGGDVRPYIPHRVDEGYGLHKEALTQLARDGARVIVTVDCGVRSLEEIAHANQAGLDVIVTDHHSVGDKLPDAVAVIDPKRADSTYPFHELAGVGVAFKLAQALLRSHRQTLITRQAVRLEEEDLLDLVALGTITDLVPLLGENRTLVHKGLERINRRERPGIEALCRRSGLRNGQINATSIGYALGPRLNAAGRMGHAKTAYQLLTTQYPAEAERLAEALDRLNRKRRQLTLETQKQARELALATAGEAPLLFAAAPDFQAGIVGLAASRLVDEFYRPAVVVEVGKEFSRGYANPHPLFLSRNVRVQNLRTVGADGRHLKLALSGGRTTWDAIAFRQGDWAGKLPDRVDIVYHLEINVWRDQRRLQLNVQDIRPAGQDDVIARLSLGQSELEPGESGT